MIMFYTNPRRAVDSWAGKRWRLWSPLIGSVLLLVVMWIGFLVAAEGAPPPQDETSWPAPLKELSLAVPSGNGYYPKCIVAAPGTGRIYTLNEGTDVYETGSTISVLDEAKQQVVDTYALGKTEFEGRQLVVVHRRKALCHHQLCRRLFPHSIHLQCVVQKSRETN